MPQPKVFIIGLPRTATTSLCVACLHLGFKTAHTAYTKNCLENAQIIADTPVFSDYQDLDKMYPNAKFIYLTRDLSLWLPSIKQLLQRMIKNLLRTDGGFNPHLKKSYHDIFSPLTEKNIADEAFLSDCYLRHQRQVESYFQSRPSDLLTIDIAAPDSFMKLIAFLELPSEQISIESFQPINIGGKVTAWNDIKHPNKVPSTNNGRIDKIL